MSQCAQVWQVSRSMHACSTGTSSMRHLPMVLINAFIRPVLRHSSLYPKKETAHYIRKESFFHKLAWCHGYLVKCLSKEWWCKTMIHESENKFKKNNDTQKWEQIKKNNDTRKWEQIVRRQNGMIILWSTCLVEHLQRLQDPYASQHRSVEWHDRPETNPHPAMTHSLQCVLSVCA